MFDWTETRLCYLRITPGGCILAGLCYQLMVDWTESRRCYPRMIDWTETKLCYRGIHHPTKSPLNEHPVVPFCLKLFAAFSPTLMLAASHSAIASPPVLAASLQLSSDAAHGDVLFPLNPYKSPSNKKTNCVPYNTK